MFHIKLKRTTNILHCSDKQIVLLEKFAPLLLLIRRCEIKYCGKITDFFFLFMSSNIFSMHLVAHDQRFSRQVR